MRKTITAASLVTLMLPFLAIAQTHLSDPPVTQASCPTPVTLGLPQPNLPGAPSGPGQHPVPLCNGQAPAAFTAPEVVALIHSSAYKMFLKDAIDEAGNEGLTLKPVSANLIWSGVSESVAVNFNFYDRGSVSSPGGKISAQIKLDSRGKIYLQYIESTIFPSQPGGASVGN